MSVFSDDPWVASRSPIDALKLHALGNVTLAWNYCELNLVIIFTLVTEIFDGPGWLVARDLGDITLINKMREALELREKDETVKCRIAHMLKVYDACRVNRNHLTHFSLVKAGNGSFTLARRKGPTPQPTKMPSELADIRRVADELWALVAYLRSMVKFLRSRNSAKPSPLPQKVAVPELLLKPPPQAQPKRKRQRPPFRK